MDILIPEKLETDRLVLRTFEDADWKDMHILYSDEECTRYTIQRTLTEGESWRMMAALIGHWQLRGYGPYALEEKQSSQVIGTCGLWYPNDWPEPEIKWALARKFWGKGFASEAAKAVLVMITKHMPELRPISLILEENHPSRKLAENLEAILESKLTFRNQPAIIYRHKLPD